MNKLDTSLKTRDQVIQPSSDDYGKINGAVIENLYSKRNTEQSS